MEHETTHSEARQQYDAAHNLHYQVSDLLGALRLYQGVMVSHPDSREASYSRSQILNIISVVVPEEKLFNVQVDLALSYIDHDEEPD